MLSSTNSGAVDAAKAEPNTSVEMSQAHGDIVPSTSEEAQEHGDELTTTQTASSVQHFPHGPTRTDTTTAFAQALESTHKQPPKAVITNNRARAQSTAIGPSVEQVDSIAKDEDDSGPRLELTLLLTNGARHPFILDAKYLAKRNVDAQGNDPFNLSVYKLKELILREWRDEWEQKPSNPSFIRLISFGKLLDDKAALKDLKFNRTERNVVHMTIKPQDFVDDDDGKNAKAGFSTGRPGNEERSPGCRCVIM